MRVLVEGVVLVAVALISTFALAVTDVVQGAENQIAARMLRQPVLDWCNLSLATNRDKPNGGFHGDWRARWDSNPRPTG